MNTVLNLVALIIAIIGIIWIIHTLWMNSRINNVKNWTRVDAQITKIGAEAVNAPKGVAWLVPSEINPNSNQKYIPHVIYKYTVNGQTYERDGIEYNNNAKLNGIQTQNLLNLFPVGSTVKIYVNPANPTEAWIYPGKPSYTGLWLGILLFVAAAFFAYSMNKPHFNLNKGTGTFFSDSVPSISLTDIKNEMANASNMRFH